MIPGLSIQREAPDTSEATALIRELDTYLNERYAPENRHGLSVTALKDPSVIFLVARIDGVAIGCGGIKFFQCESLEVIGYAEVKRMYVKPVWRGRGVAQSLLSHLEHITINHGFTLIRLETGIHQAEAIRLYEGMGYARCDVFGAYLNNGISLCYEKSLSGMDPIDQTVS